ncbi:uncharacterized protein FA14DRAFT_118501 [Meira miltonrushii]|uniref:ER transporter 6TM N-terminal domain-containing protein n=1 Tax=Meira miltonrushii TaxID=1280837 RepID=A0A316VK75_9BASI|nr:uncharacterized protein FA14DRAFT_118501 [Meira miltonrushii]PWN37634.1 hypothetical protein FA14DRAFT_118501 [Meira miltonrushii]
MNENQQNINSTKNKSIGTKLQSIKLPGFIAWIPPVVKDWSKLKPVLRSALAAWICMVFMLIDPVEKMLGNASFLILIGIFIQPAELPVVAVIEREFFTLLLTSTCWAYANLAILFAHLARKRRLSPAETDIRLVFTGEYIETAPSAICTAFLAVGVALTLYLKVKFGPSPFIFATILGCICLDIVLVYAPLYPYPQYILGRTIMVPLAVKAGIVILVSLVFFPKSVNSAFVERLLNVLRPLEGSSEQLRQEMKNSALDPTFNFELYKDKVLAAEAGLLPLQGQARLLLRELSFSLASGEDLQTLVLSARRLLAPADGIAFYFSLVYSDVRGMDIKNHPRMPQFITPGQTRPSTPIQTRPTTPIQSKPGTPFDSRPSTPQLEESAMSKDAIDNTSSHDSSYRGGGVGSTRPRHRFPSKLSAGLIHPTPQRHSFELRKRLHELTHPHHHKHAPIEVGLWESIRYTAFESQFHGRENDHISEMCMRILAEASEDLLVQQGKVYADIRNWLQKLNGERTSMLVKLCTFRSTKLNSTLLQNKDGSPRLISDTIAELEAEIEKFKKRKQRIIEPFRASVDANVEGDKLPHRYLFQSLTFCHFQVVYSQRLIEFLRKLENIEKRRKAFHFWFPKPPSLFRVDAWSTHEAHGEGEHDEDPDEVPGMISSLGQTKARDPDAMDSDSRLQELGIKLSSYLHTIHKGNSLFMIKVAVTTVLVALPSILRSSAGWAYKNKAIWVIIMSQLCAARHRGEVLFGFFSRVIATFLGAIGGLIIWYIASGSGVANPFALAVVTAIAFPIVMMGRIHFPGPPITPIITCVTVALIVGYSWMDSHNPTPGSPGIGWEIGWRRFIEVIIGAAAAYIMSILPPTSSMRTYFRLSHATIIRETGGLFCENIYLAATPGQHDTKDVLDKLLAVRSKIRRLSVLKGSISFEWSLRGKWPIHRYEHLERIELRILRLLTHAITIYESLGPAYSRALLKRTRFLDPTFLADCIAVLSMCTTSLSTGQPLPQIAPVLIDRYMCKPMGFKIRSHEVTDTPDETLDDIMESLPATVTFETLLDEKYQTFAVGASVAFGITVHLDRLCVAVKSLVGETYAVPADLQTYHPFSSAVKH